MVRELEYGNTKIINSCERYVLEIPEREHLPRQHNQLIWKTRYRNFYKDD